MHYIKLTPGRDENDTQTLDLTLEQTDEDIVCLHCHKKLTEHQSSKYVDVYKDSSVAGDEYEVYQLCSQHWVR